MGVVIEHIKEPIVKIYDEIGKEIGIAISELDFLNVLVQINQQRLEGYTFSVFGINEKGEQYWSEPIKISSSGHVKAPYCPFGKYDEFLKILAGF